MLCTVTKGLEISGNFLILLVCAMCLPFSENRTAHINNSLLSLQFAAQFPRILPCGAARIEPQSSFDHSGAFCHCATDTSRNSRFSASISTEGMLRSLIHHCKISGDTSERLWGIRHAFQILVISWKCLLTRQTIATKFILFKPQVSGIEVVNSHNDVLFPPKP